MEKDNFYQEQLDAQRGMLSSAINELVKKNEALEGAMEILHKRNDELQKIAYRSFHDMKSPMVNLEGLLELVKLETDNKTVLNLLEQAHSMVNRLDTFGLALNDYTQVIQRDLRPESIDFKKLEQDIIQTCSRVNGHDKVSINIDVSEVNQDFIFDQYRLQVLFGNLLSYSIYYRDVDKEECWCSISMSIESNGRLVIKVEDNGMGIDESTLPRIFDMFYKANNQGTGPGLGLYIVNTIVKEAEGEIKLESMLGAGTTLSIELPALR